MSDNQQTPTIEASVAADGAAPADAVAPSTSTSAEPAAAAVVDVAAMTPEERAVYARDLFGRGSRNYLVKEYAEAADDLSEACTLYEEIYGNKADELGMPYLLYAKSLIALAQGGENKLLADVPEEQEEEEDDEDEEGAEEGAGAAADADGKTEAVDKSKPEADAADGSKDDPDAGAAAAGPSNGTAAAHTNGKSGAATNEEDTAEGEGEEAEDDSPAANLQVAWEVLELAVQIFQRTGASAASNLADAYFELAEISLENSHFETSIRDYKNSLEIHMKLPDNNLRLIAEIEYKIGLGQMMLCDYEESVVAFRKACEVLDAEIATQKEAAGADSKSAASSSVITELEELKVEIVNKITEVEEAKQQSIEILKKEMDKCMSHEPLKKASVATDESSGASAAAEGGSSSAEGSAPGGSAASAAPKAMDISHLVKRKKPDTVSADGATEGSPPAKKPAP